MYDNVTNACALKERIIKTDHLLRSLQENTNEVANVKNKYKSLLLKYSEQAKLIKLLNDEHLKLNSSSKFHEEKAATCQYNYQTILKELEECRQKLQESCTEDSPVKPDIQTIKKMCKDNASIYKLKSDTSVRTENVSFHIQGPIDSNDRLIEENRNELSLKERLHEDYESLRETHKEDLKKLTVLTLEYSKLKTRIEDSKRKNEQIGNVQSKQELKKIQSKLKQTESELENMTFMYETEIGNLKLRCSKFETLKSECKEMKQVINRVEREKRKLQNELDDALLEKNLLTDELRNLKEKLNLQAEDAKLDSIFDEMIEFPQLVSPMDCADSMSEPLEHSEQPEPQNDNVQFHGCGQDERIVQDYIPILQNENLLGFKERPAISNEANKKPWEEDLKALREDMMNNMMTKIVNEVSRKLIKNLGKRKMDTRKVFNFRRLRVRRHSESSLSSSVSVTENFATKLGLHLNLGQEQSDTCSDREIGSIDSGYFKSDSEISEVLQNNSRMVEECDINTGSVKRPIDEDEAPQEKRKKTTRKVTSREKCNKVQSVTKRSSLIPRMNPSPATKADFENRSKAIAKFKNEKISTKKEEPKAAGSFKRPVKRTILIESPASPTQEDRGEQVSSPIGIIPLERSAVFSNGNTFSKKQVTNFKQKIPDETASLLEKLINFHSEQTVLEEVAKAFCARDRKHIIKSILERVSKDTGKHDSKFSPPAPLMTQTQRVLLGLMSKLEQLQFNVFDEFVNQAEKQILRETSVESIASISRLYLAVCKYKGLLFRVRRLCCDALYYMRDLAVPFICTTLLSWGDVIPKKNLPGNTPIVKVLIEVVNLKSPKPGHNLPNLKTCLKFHGYSDTVEPDSDELLRELYQQLIETESEELEYALALLCKNHPNNWVFRHIESLFKPFVNVTTNHRSKAITIKLVGHLCRQFTMENDACMIKNIELWLRKLKENDLHEVTRNSIAFALDLIPI